MKDEEFKRLYMCSFEPDPIFLEIEEAYRSIYFNDRPHDREFRHAMRELTQYVKEVGLTMYQFAEIKKRVQGEHEQEIKKC